MNTPHQPTPLHGIRLLREKQVRDLLGGISRGTFWSLRRRDRSFPLAVQMTAGLTAYREDEIRAWIAARPQAECVLRVKPKAQEPAPAAQEQEVPVEGPAPVQAAEEEER